MGLYQERQSSHAWGCDRPARRSTWRGVATISNVPTSHTTLPRAQRAHPRVQVGDLVLRRVQGNKDQHKLASHGRSHSSSIKYSDPKRSRSDTRMVESSQTLGTSSTYDRFTLKQMFTPYESMNKCRMPCSCIYEFIDFLVSMFLYVATFQRLSGKHYCTCAEMLAARGLPRARCPPFVLPFPKQKINNNVATNRTCKRFFGVKMVTCVWLGTCARSTFLAPMPPWLRCEGLRAQSESTGFHPTSFQKRSSNRLGSDLKRLWQKIHELLFEFPRVLRSESTFRLLSGFWWIEWQND
jgi:hypothetical protein